MKRLAFFFAFVFAFVSLALVSSPIAAQETGPGGGEVDAAGFVYVVKPGKSPLRAEPKMEASVKSQVAYGQKLALKKKIGDRWLLVNVPGDPAQGWIPANVVLDKRPTVEHKPVGAGSARVIAAEGSSAMAIRGLDGRTAAYAQAKQISPMVIDQLGRIEAHGETLFSDRHSVDAKGAWHYPDATAPGRFSAGQQFAQSEGLRSPVRK